MSRAQLRRLEILEAQQRTHAQAALTRWADILWGLIDAGEVEAEELDRLLGLVQRHDLGDRSPESVAALARWEALLKETPELGRRTSLLVVWDWWKVWADVWQRA
jgi:hypothetical protein